MSALANIAFEGMFFGHAVYLQCSIILLSGGRAIVPWLLRLMFLREKLNDEELPGNLPKSQLEAGSRALTSKASTSVSEKTSYRWLSGAGAAGHRGL